MGFSEETYAQLRPYLYHSTNRDNVARIVATRRLESAASLLELANRKDALIKPRRQSLPMRIDGYQAILCDRSPLHEKNIRFTNGWAFSEFVKYVNEHVFFWSGWERGLVDYGLRHFERYSSERPIILRVPFLSLRDQNPGAATLFCRYNSGSPRWSGGRPSPRGPETFQHALTCDFTPGQVVEVVFRDSVALSRDVEFANGFSGPWRPFESVLPSAAGADR